MTTGSVQDRYLEARVLSATPVELVRMLYGAALDSVSEARRHLAAGQIAARSREISRAVAIVAELSSSLDRAAGGSLAQNLAELYDYLQRRLIEANIRQSDDPLAEAIGLLMTLSEAWAQVPEPAPDVPEMAVPAGGYGGFGGETACAGQSWSA